MIFSNNLAIYIKHVSKIIFIPHQRIQDTTFQQKGTETTSSVSSFEDKGSCRQNYWSATSRINSHEVQLKNMPHFITQS